MKDSSESAAGISSAPSGPRAGSSSGALRGRIASIGPSGILGFIDHAFGGNLGLSGSTSRGSSAPSPGGTGSSAGALGGGITSVGSSGVLRLIDLALVSDGRGLGSRGTAGATSAPSGPRAGSGSLAFRIVEALVGAPPVLGLIMGAASHNLDGGFGLGLSLGSQSSGGRKTEFEHS